LNEPALIASPSHTDERGIVCPVELEEPAVRFYLSRNWMVGQVRAWHGHPKEWRVVRCLTGSAKVCAMRMKKHADVREFVLTDQKSEVLYIPAGWANGWKGLSHNCELLYLAPTHYEDRDDVRIDGEIQAQVWKRGVGVW
jgi:dTDP-4-dehydrorhamnose 3,5-epimerase-like enzyme